MPRQLHWKAVVAAGVAALVAGAGHSETAPSSWAKVPALPTNCYSTQDTFAAKSGLALDALLAEQQKQDSVNRRPR